LTLSDALDDLKSILELMAGPLLLAAGAALLAWLYRRWKWPADSRARPPESGRPGRRLSARRAASVASAPAGSEAAIARAQASRVNARVHSAHAGAWLVYAAVIGLLMALIVDAGLPLSVRIAVGCAFALSQLVILLWAIDLPVPARFLIVLLCAAVGVSLLLAIHRPQYAWVVARELTKVAILPIPALLILFIRRNQPFLIFLIAMGLYFMGSGAVMDKGFHSFTMSEVAGEAGKPWLFAFGLGNIVLGFVGAWALLRQRRLLLRAIAVAAGVVAAVLLVRDLAHPILPLGVKVFCFIALAVLQIFLLWGLFKILVWLGERRFLTPQLVQVHLCWAFFTWYLVETTLDRNPLYGDRLAVRWGAIIAWLLFIVTLHVLLVEVYRRSDRRAQKSLLLLRVFGRPNEREDLLDDLDDTWRRIGEVELLAASDVASRTLESHMLELFLLRQDDDQFLRSESDVMTRIGQRRSTIEGDARYPVNAFFCHESVWWSAFTKLAESSDVIMMDLRGFTAANQGCVRELEHLLRHEPRRVVFVSDRHSDLLAVEELADKAGVTEGLTILDFGKRSRDERRALFDLLLRAAYG
jgi:hypothetical protein